MPKVAATFSFCTFHFSLYMDGFLPLSSFSVFSSISFGWLAVFAARPFARLQAPLLTAIVVASNWQCACALHLGNSTQREKNANETSQATSDLSLELSCALGSCLDRLLPVCRSVGSYLLGAGRASPMTRARAHTKVQRTTTGLSSTSISRSLSINHFANVESMFVLIKILSGFSQVLFVFVCALLLLRAN